MLVESDYDFPDQGKAIQGDDVQQDGIIWLRVNCN